MTGIENISLLRPIISIRDFTGWFTRDGRHFQILYLSLFLIYGIFNLGWDVGLTKFFVIFSVGMAVQALALYLVKAPMHGLKSGLITCLGLCLLLKADSHWALAIAAAVAIGSKFVIRVRGKHLFNPANIGIIAAITLTNDAWISPGQWGSSIILLFLIGILGLVVLFRVGRVDTSLGFLITFAALDYCRTVLYLGWEPEVWLHKMQNGSLLLFAFFMITDPKTTPNAPVARIIWSMLIGVATFVVSNWLYFHTAPIWVLFFIAPLTVLFDRFFKHKPFQW